MRMQLEGAVGEGGPVGKACLVNLEGAVGKQRISRVGERLSQ